MREAISGAMTVQVLPRRLAEQTTRNITTKFAFDPKLFSSEYPDRSDSDIELLPGGHNWVLVRGSAQEVRKSIRDAAKPVAKANFNRSILLTVGVVVLALIVGVYLHPSVPLSGWVPAVIGGLVLYFAVTAEKWIVLDGVINISATIDANKILWSQYHGEEAWRGHLTAAERDRLFQILDGEGIETFRDVLHVKMKTLHEEVLKQKLAARKADIDRARSLAVELESDSRQSDE